MVVVVVVVVVHRKAEEKQILLFVFVVAQVFVDGVFELEQDCFD